MSLNDPLGDMLTRIRNAYGRKKSKVSTPAIAAACWDLNLSKLNASGFPIVIDSSSADGVTISNLGLAAGSSAIFAS